ncbi:hypothetical protein Efla_001175 [Eimeria flavescens]
MFADENAFFSPSAGSSEFLSSEPRKSLGGLGGGPLESPMGGAQTFGAADDVGAPVDPFSQEPAASQRGPPAAGGPQTPDGCVCATIGMLRRAVKARTGGGTLQLNGRDVGLIGLCGLASDLDVRASMFKFTLEDVTGKMEVECSIKGALAELKESERGAQEKEGPPVEAKGSGLASALRGGVVTVYGFACTDDKGDVYVDCFKVNAVSDMREYVELFPLRIIAGAIEGRAPPAAPLKTEANAAPSSAPKEELDEAAMQAYEHISDPAQRAVLGVLLAAKGQAVKRQKISSSAGGFAASDVEAALLALEESGEIALTATWVSLAS